MIVQCNMGTTHSTAGDTSCESLSSTRHALRGYVGCKRCDSSGGDGELHIGG